jgi:two-component system cell cycle sensor histidine kinase/response regulator CckA
MTGHVERTMPAAAGLPEPFAMAAWATAPMAVAFVDRDLRVRWTNAAMGRLTGEAPEVHTGRGLGDLFSGAAPLAGAARAAMQGDGPRDVRCTATLAGAALRHLRGTAHAVADATGAPVGACCVVADVTDEARMAGELWQTQKLEAAGHLANIVAHDVNNLVVVIQGYSDLLLAKATDEVVKERLGRIRSAAGAASALSKQMLALSRRNSGTVSAVNLNMLLRTLKPVFERGLPPNVKRSFVMAEDLALVVADPGQLDQVVVNLVANAVDAMPNGGTLTIETVNVAAPVTDAPATLAAGAYVRLRVRDTGTGMDAPTLARLFEPGFTTKPADDGGGLGLVSVRTMVRAMGGDVTVESAPGAGTTATVWVPQGAAPPDGGTPVPGRERVTALLVDPSDDVRALCVPGLDAFGVTVLSASTATEAAAIAAAHVGPIDVVVAAELLPDGDGPAVAQALAIRRAGLRAVIVTAGDARATPVDDLVRRGCRAIAKPLTLHALAEAIRAAAAATSLPPS